MKRSFFASKYELTQAQWMRFAGGNPSGFKMGELRDGCTVSGRHPVEMVSWDEACDVLAALGLALPTDAQWEYAARGVTTSVWYTGDALASLDGAANVGYPYEFLRETSDLSEPGWLSDELRRDGPAAITRAALQRGVPLAVRTLECFARLLGVSDEQDREKGRARYRFYRDRGYEIRSHDLSSSAE